MMNGCLSTEHSQFKDLLLCFASVTEYIGSGMLVGHQSEGRAIIQYHESCFKGKRHLPIFLFLFVVVVVYIKQLMKKILSRLTEDGKKMSFAVLRFQAR